MPVHFLGDDDDDDEHGIDPTRATASKRRNFPRRLIYSRSEWTCGLDAIASGSRFVGALMRSRRNLYLAFIYSRKEWTCGLDAIAPGSRFVGALMRSPRDLYLARSLRIFVSPTMGSVLRTYFIRVPAVIMATFDPLRLGS